MLYAEQIRAARALLGWKQVELATRSGIGLATIKRVEVRPGPMQGSADTAWRIQGALEEAGIIFIDGNDSRGPGVQLSKPVAKHR